MTSACRGGGPATASARGLGLTEARTGAGTETTGGGQTNADNLHALCRKHHLLKTHAGRGIVRDPETAITTWTTPTGRVHTRPPTVLDTHIELDQIDPDTSPTTCPCAP